MQVCAEQGEDFFKRAWTNESHESTSSAAVALVFVVYTNSRVLKQMSARRFPEWVRMREGHIGEEHGHNRCLI